MRRYQISVADQRRLESFVNGEAQRLCAGGDVFWLDVVNVQKSQRAAVVAIREQVVLKARQSILYLDQDGVRRIRFDTPAWISRWKPISLPMLAELFNAKNHTTILLMLRRIKEREAANDSAAVSEG